MDLRIKSPGFHLSRVTIKILTATQHLLQLNTYCNSTLTAT